MKTASLLVLVGLIAIGSGCDLFDGPAAKSQSVAPGVGGGSAGTGGTSGGGAGIGGTSSKPDCLGLPGPGMVELTTPSGARYCIDRTEVTQAQYAEFLAKVTDKPGGEHERCATNERYEPELALGSMEGKSCYETIDYTPEATPHRPMACVDWCDGVAYCKWAGKRLCGKVGGGEIALTTEDDPNDPAVDANQSQWYGACSQGGKTLYPYGNVYDAEACEGKDAAIVDGDYAPKGDVRVRPACTGNEDPYSLIHDLSGSVVEMTDECNFWAANGKWYCLMRGGSRVSLEEGLTCKRWAAQDTREVHSGKGFRCCKDLP